MLLLSNRVIYQRLKNGQYIGDRINSEKDHSGNHQNVDPLYLESRCHLNFLEHVPFAFILALIVEINGGDKTLLNYAMAVLFVLRIAHVEIGLRSKDTLGYGRAPGILGTQALMAAMAVYGAYLVRGYWGY